MHVKKMKAIVCYIILYCHFFLSCLYFGNMTDKQALSNRHTTMNATLTDIRSGVVKVINYID